MLFRRLSAAPPLCPGRPGSRPRRSQQIKFSRPIPRGNEFVAYIDAIRKLDGTLCMFEWMITGASEVAQVVFVRKRMVEVQYLPTSISEAQRQKFPVLLEDTIQQIDSGQISTPFWSSAFPRTAA